MPDYAELVPVVNPNGRIGYVAPGSAAAQHYKTPPSAKPTDGTTLPPSVEAAATGAYTEQPTRPAANASADAWRTYAVSAGMPAEDADQLSRDELAAHYADTTQEG